MQGYAHMENPVFHQQLIERCKQGSWSIFLLRRVQALGQGIRLEMNYFELASKKPLQGTKVVADIASHLCRIECRGRVWLRQRGRELCIQPTGRGREGAGRWVPIRHEKGGNAMVK